VVRLKQLRFLAAFALAAALPGAQVEIATRHSVKVPAAKSSSSVIPGEPPKSKADPYKDDPFRD